MLSIVVDLTIYQQDKLNVFTDVNIKISSVLTVTVVYFHADLS